jgi:hypothetical protein
MSGGTPKVTPVYTTTTVHASAGRRRRGRGRLRRAFGWFRRQRPAVQILAVLLVLATGFMVVHTSPTWGDIPIYMSDETEALARVIRSEVGNGTPEQRVHVAWATRNLARSRNQSIAQMACMPCGPQGLGRPVSTRQDATDDDRALARAVLAAPPLIDPTGGACHFISPALQDRLAASGAPGYTGRSYEVVRRRWSETLQPYYRLGDDLEMWGPKR